MLCSGSFTFFEEREGKLIGQEEGVVETGSAFNGDAESLRHEVVAYEPCPCARCGRTLLSNGTDFVVVSNDGEHDALTLGYDYASCTGCGEKARMSLSKLASFPTRQEAEQYATKNGCTVGDIKPMLRPVPTHFILEINYTSSSLPRVRLTDTRCPPLP